MNVFRPGEGIDATPHRHRRRLGVRRTGEGAPIRRLPDAHRAVERGRRVRPGRHPAGGVLLDSVRGRACLARAGGPAGGADARPADGGFLPDRRPRDGGGADRRVRGDGLHDRQLRGGLAAHARPPHGLRVRHDGALHLRRAQRHRPVCGVQPVPPAGVHQGRDSDRPRHVVERGGAAADARQDGTLRLRPAGGRRW